MKEGEGQWRPMPSPDAKRFVERYGSEISDRRELMPKPETTISNSTRIELTIPQMVGLIVALVGLYVSYTSQQEQTKALIEKSSQQTNIQLLDLSQKLTAMQWQMKGFVTDGEARDFADDLRSANPNLHVPPFKHARNNEMP